MLFRSHAYDLTVWANDELAERVTDSTFKRNTPLPFNVDKGKVRIAIADPTKAYQISINGGEKKTLTPAQPYVEADVPLRAINNVIPITVYDKDGLKIKVYDLHITRDAADSILGAIYVDGNKAEKVQDSATGEVYFEAYAYRAPKSNAAIERNALVEVYAVDSKAKVVLTRGEEPNIERWTGDLNGYLAATVDGLEEDSAAGVPEKSS